MTTEFDRTCFSVVAKFFGNDQPGQQSKPSVEVQPPPTNRVGRGRQGVGAAVPTRKNQESETMKKILQIGRKRQRDNDDDDEASGGGQETDEEDFEGRTAISKKTTTKAPPREIASQAFHPEGSSKKEKKKKLGKKERRARQNESDAENKAFGNDKSQSNEDVIDGNQSAIPHRKKKKRKKIRSKQKNICKDKRSNQEKPAHLRPGNGRLYDGRPMTETTRAKLKLPPSKTEKRRETTEERPRHEHELEHMTLAIDELDAVDIGEPSPAPGEKLDTNKNTGTSVKPSAGERASKKRTKKKKEKKRSKYKNL